MGPTAVQESVSAPVQDVPMDYVPTPVQKSVPDDVPASTDEPKLSDLQLLNQISQDNDNFKLECERSQQQTQNNNNKYKYWNNNRKPPPSCGGGFGGGNLGGPRLLF